MTQERATDEAFVIEPDGRIHDLKRARILPTARELRQVIGGAYRTTDLDGRAGLVLVHGEDTEEGQPNHRASGLLGTRQVKGPAIVMARRLVP